MPRRPQRRQFPSEPTPLASETNATTAGASKSSEKRCEHRPVHTPGWRRLASSIGGISLRGAMIKHHHRVALYLGRSGSERFHGCCVPNKARRLTQNRLALLGKESVSVGHRRHPLSVKSGEPTHAHLHHR